MPSCRLFSLPSPALAGDDAKTITPFEIILNRDSRLIKRDFSSKINIWDSEYGVENVDL